MTNYIVTTQCWNGKRVTHCETINEVWEAIGKMAFGGIYSVQSPTGLDVSDFVPF